MRIFPVFVFLFLALPVIAQDEKTLDPATMAQREKGKLPKTTKTRTYEIGRVIDDCVLIAMREQGSRKPVRFYFRSPDLVKKYEGKENGKWLAIAVELPDVVYAVIDRKTLDGSPLPVIAVAKQTPKK